MKIYSIPPQPRAILFDIDRTLYENETYARHQEDVLVTALADHLNLSVPDAQTRVNQVRDEMTRNSGGKRPSLANTFLALGVDVAQSVRWREHYILPEQYLGPDPALREALQVLQTGRSTSDHAQAVPARIGLRTGCLTNNPSAVGRRTLEVIGIADLMDFVIGLDDTMASKPDPVGFRMACRRWGVSAEHIISVGDRVPVDIDPALELGMGAILVEGISDLYVGGPLLEALGLPERKA